MERKVVVCNCGGGLIDSEDMKVLTSSLGSEGVQFTLISDWCGANVLSNSEITPFFQNDEILVVACYPRVVKLLLQQAGIEPVSKSFSYLNYREHTANEILKQIREYVAGEPTGPKVEVNSSSDWPSWYPVIDYARCTSCGQCADFCLFGVYEKSENKVWVTNPQGCKNNCPACARICPHTAIVFPKYKQDGAIAGSEIIDEIAEQQRHRQDLDTILGSDIYKALEQRKAKRQTIIKTEAMNKALEERDKALKEKQ